MGAAYGYNGEFLGDATGTTKEEVFQTLNERYPDAAEIAVRHLGEGETLAEARRAAKRKARNRRRARIAAGSRARNRH